MADIKFNCPACEHKLSIDEKAAGYLVDCPVCGVRIQIPLSPEPPRVEMPHKPARPAVAETHRKSVTQPIQLGASTAEADARIRELERENARLRSELASLQPGKEVNSALEFKVADLLQKLESMSARVAKAQSTANEAQRDRDAAEKNLEAARRESASGRAEAEKSTAALRTELEEARRQAAAHAGAVERLSALEAENASLANAAREHVRARQELEQRHQELQQRVAGLEASVSGWQTRHAELERERTRERESAAAASDSRPLLQEKESRIAALQTELATLGKQKQEELRKIGSELEQATARAARLQSDYDRMLSRIKELEAENRRAKEEIKDMTLRASPTAADMPAPALQPVAGKEPVASEEGTRERQPLELPAAKSPSRPTASKTMPLPARRAGTSLYAGKGRATSRRKVNIPRAALWAVAALLLAAVVSWLYFSGALRSLMAGWKTAPERAIAPAPPIALRDGVLQKDPRDAASDSGGAALGEMIDMGAVRVRVSGARIGTVLRVTPLGETRETERPFLSLAIELSNPSRTESVFLLHAWEQAVLIDEDGRSYQPAFPTRYAVDRVVGTLEATELKPGQSMTDKLVFDVPSAESERFRLRAAPGFWRKTTSGAHTAISTEPLEVAFSRGEIQNTEAHEAEPSMGSPSNPPDGLE